MAATHADPQDWLRDYFRHPGKHLEFLDVLEKWLEQCLKDAAIEPHWVSGRMKDASSLIQKVWHRPGKDPQQEVSDFVGVRAVVVYPKDVSQVVAFVYHHFEIKKVKFRGGSASYLPPWFVERHSDKVDEQRADQFGYSGR